MKIAIIQAELAWENPKKNRDNFQEKIDKLLENVDLIVLPEMFTTGFSMKPKPIAETMDGETIGWMKNVAKKKNCAITGSIVIEEKKLFFNRMLFVFPDGNVVFYDKRHLFSLAGEQKNYTAGSQKKTVDYRGLKFCLLICYDLRFPVFSRNVDGYDVLLYVANWPKPRIAAWDTLLRARAIENMSYAIGVNRTGLDANQNEYCGHSQVVDYLGQYILAPQSSDGVFIVDLNKKLMLEARQKFGFLNDRDGFKLASAQPEY